MLKQNYFPHYCEKFIDDNKILRGKPWVGKYRIRICAMVRIDSHCKDELSDNEHRKINLFELFTINTTLKQTAFNPGHLY